MTSTSSRFKTLGYPRRALELLVTVACLTQSTLLASQSLDRTRDEVQTLVRKLEAESTADVAVEKLKEMNREVVLDSLLDPVRLSREMPMFERIRTIDLVKWHRGGSRTDGLEFLLKQCETEELSSVAVPGLSIAKPEDMPTVIATLINVYSRSCQRIVDAGAAEVTGQSLNVSTAAHAFDIGWRKMSEHALTPEDARRLLKCGDEWKNDARLPPELRAQVVAATLSRELDAGRDLAQFIPSLSNLTPEIRFITTGRLVTWASEFSENGMRTPEAIELRKNTCREIGTIQDPKYRAAAVRLMSVVWPQKDTSATSDNSEELDELLLAHTSDIDDDVRKAAGRALEERSRK